MKQYLDLLTEIKERGTYKPAARQDMPSTQSLFGYQFRHNLANGFPLLTTKKMFWKGVVVELLWFLRGDSNIKYLVDNGVNIWNEDAYQYYLKRYKQEFGIENKPYYGFEDFINKIKNKGKEEFGYSKIPNYSLGDCGYQYGKVWREWEKIVNDEQGPVFENEVYKIDQIKNVINSLKNNPESRRHIVTAIDPVHDTDLALYWCHAMFQFNCRPLCLDERVKFVADKSYNGDITKINPRILSEDLDRINTPKYYLDCQLYQRSADVVLGVPFNIASYALLTEILAKICNMIPGEFIHTFGDVHIYDNHKDAVEEQLKRKPTELPKLKLNEDLWKWTKLDTVDIDDLFNDLKLDDFILLNYTPQLSIKAVLSTGFKK